MNSASFLDWFSSQTVSAWIVAACSIAGLMITLFIRKRPQRVVCREITKTSLVRIRESAKKKIVIFFKDKPVENLAQLETEIYNAGTEVIENIELTFKYPEGTKILDVPEITPNDIEVEIKDHQVQVKIPYLNPLRQHKHKPRVTMVVDGTVDNVQVIGGGKGWSTRQITFPTQRQLKFRLKLSVVLFFAVGLLVILFGRIMEIESYEVSKRTVLLALSCLVVVGGLYIWAIRSIILPVFRRIK